MSLRDFRSISWSFNSLNKISLIFFISGFSALIYQVVWQRVLYATFGINIESVTVIVSVFMFGLGMGALLGAHLCKKFSSKILEVFIVIELAIGLFGLVSIPLIYFVGQHVHQNSLVALIETSYMLLAFPTMLMGATLPLLAEHLRKYVHNLDTIVAKLYAFNTLGSGLASLITVKVFFVFLGEQSTIFIAALCNGITGFFIYNLYRGIPGQLDMADVVQVESDTFENRHALTFLTTLWASLLIGYVSLSLEILWFRVTGLINGGRPQTFGILLAMFLGGIGCGSLDMRNALIKSAGRYNFMWRTLLKMGLVVFLTLPCVASVCAYIGKPAGNRICYLVVVILGYYSGSIFPLLCHTKDSQKNAAIVVGRIYFLNIVGATVGALFTGLILLDVFSLSMNMAIVAGILILTSGMFYLLNPFRKKLSFAFYVPVVTLAIAALYSYPVLYNHIIDELILVDSTHHVFKYLEENRSGVISVIEDTKHGDIVMGSGAYDGRLTIDPVLNSNLIRRAYMIPALHPNPERILDIGLSGGAWTRVISMYQPLKQLVNVEINPGYVKLIQYYPNIAPILHDPKVSLVTDDGRRWLNHHPDEHFDIIVMNTTFYWRSNATNLLSREFLELCKRHLNPGGIIYYNSTGARDSIYTAAHVFSHVVLVNNFIAASDHAFDMSVEQKRKNLLSFLDRTGQPLFLTSDATRKLLEKLINRKLEDIHDSILKDKNLWLITDDNMAVEYKAITEF